MPRLITDSGSGSGTTNNSTDAVTLTLPAIPANRRYLVQTIHVQLASDAANNPSVRLTENGVDKMVWTAPAAAFSLDISGEGLWVSTLGATVALVIDGDADRTTTLANIFAVQVIA